METGRCGQAAGKGVEKDVAEDTVECVSHGAGYNLTPVAISNVPTPSAE